MGIAVGAGVPIAGRQVEDVLLAGRIIVPEQKSDVLLDAPAMFRVGGVWSMLKLRVRTSSWLLAGSVERDRTLYCPSEEKDAGDW
jgi:hypothetical protein